jgi:alpha-galactosidase
LNIKGMSLTKLKIMKHKKSSRRDFIRKSIIGASLLGLPSVSSLSGRVSGLEINSPFQNKSKSDPLRLTPKPPLGWNSYDCFLGDGTKFDSANEWRLNENLEVFAEKLKPFGYEYFVLDCRWFAPTADGSLTRLDEYGRSLPSEFRFPNGFKPMIDKAHNMGIKFGIHLIRGIPKKAVQLNLPVKGTKSRAKDILSTEVPHRWNVMDSIDLDKPGGQEYYNSVLDILAEWGVDFLKYDEIEHFPRDIEAIAKAIAQCGRDIVLSISPGDQTDTKLMDLYKRTSNLLRITGDVWDRQESLIKCFRRWEAFQEYGGDGFWLDLDMIPFGHLCVPYPSIPGVKAPSYGYERMDSFNKDQKQTFMTQRAMSASPLFMGGHLPTTDDYSFEMITNTGMLECNQNGIVGKLAERKGAVDVWRTPAKSKADAGWIGIFNRGETSIDVALKNFLTGLIETKKYNFFNIWEKKPFEGGMSIKVKIDANGVLFLKYEAV